MQPSPTDSPKEIPMNRYRATSQRVRSVCLALAVCCTLAIAAFVDGLAHNPAAAGQTAAAGTPSVSAGTAAVHRPFRIGA